MNALQADGRARPPGRRVAGHRRHAGEIRGAKAWRCPSSPRRAARRDASTAIDPGTRTSRPVGAGRPSVRQELRAAAAMLGVRERRRCSITRTAARRRRSAARRSARIAAQLQPDSARMSSSPSDRTAPTAIRITSPISQLTARPSSSAARRPARAHRSVSKLYYLAWPRVDVGGLRERRSGSCLQPSTAWTRQATPWPDWAITTDDRRAPTSGPRSGGRCRAMQSQLASYARLADAAGRAPRTLWGTQSFYRVFSPVNGGRARETDLFEGVAR